jgi:signal transduction histidine kinase
VNLKLKILHKGLLLLLIPFILQSCLLFRLFDLVSGAEALVEKEKEQATVVEKFYDLTQTFANAWASVFNRAFGATSRGGRVAIESLTPDQFNRLVSADIDALKNVRGYGNRLSAIISEMTDLKDQQYKLLSEMHSADALEVNQANVLETMLRLRQMRQKSTNVLTGMASIRSSLEMEQKEVAETRRQDNEQLKTIKATIISVFIVQLVITIFMLSLFLSDITRRLGLLVANAKKLPKGEPVDLSVKGADEIAYLDSVLHEASSQLVQATKNRQAVIDMIAHDIRSPLMSSQLLIDMLMKQISQIDHGQDSGVRRQKFDQLHNANLQVVTLVEDLLSIDRLESGELNLDLDLMEIKAVTAMVLSTLSPQAQAKGLSLIDKTQPQEVVADKQRVYQVLSNFITNAIKHTDSGGQIVIESALSRREDELKVTVRDTGHGIAAAELPLIFDRYYQSPRTEAKSGYGLGLAISKLLIELHQGQVGVESKVGQGSAFWFTLPVDLD